MSEGRRWRRQRARRRGRARTRASGRRHISSSLTAPYFHSGKVWDLEQAVAIMGSSQLGEALNDEEGTAITAFLQSLTGTLPEVSYPVLPPETATTPRPSGEVLN